MVIYVTKRNGNKEALNIDKIHKVIMWATEGLSGVSASEVELKSQIQFYNNIKSTAIHETMIKAASELISENATNYQYVAGRLINYHLRKEVYGGYNPIRLYDHIQNNVKMGFYDSALLSDYTEDEWQVIESFIDHERDMALTYVAMEQLRGKYLTQNRVTKRILETPQVAYALIAATLFASYSKETRLSFVKDYYNAISKHDISLPTPIMAGVRTPQRQFSSCVLIESDDSLDSISATTKAIVSYVSQKAGIGIGAGRIRAIHSPVRNGDTSHTGVTPFFKLFQSAVRSCSQGGVRNGAATLYYPIWHLEVEDMLVLKNNKGTEENRIRHMDYGVQFNKLFYERLITGGDITLFSPHDLPEMYEAFFNDYDKFKSLYETAEKNTRIRKKKVRASELFSKFMQERKDTGRIYLQNVDNANTHSSFDEKKAPIRQSNLCLTGDSIVKIKNSNGIIEEVKLEEVGTLLLGDPDLRVYSYNIKRRYNQFMKIKAFAKTNPVAKVIKITDEESGKSIVCTPEHKIWTINRGYVEAQYLNENDKLKVDNGITYKVYKITNKMNNKVYYGMTKRTIEDRWKAHLSSARNGNKFRFHSAIRKYGEDNWNIELVAESKDKKFISDLETFTISNYWENNGKHNSYNAKPGGCGGWIVPEHKYKSWKSKINQKGSNNNNYNPVTNEQLIDLGVKFVKEFNFIPGCKRLKKYGKLHDIEVMQCLSPDRFGGKYINLAKEIETRTGLTYNRYFRDDLQKQLISEGLIKNKHHWYHNDNLKQSKLLSSSLVDVNIWTLGRKSYA